MFGQLFMRSKLGTNLFQYSDLMPFATTEVHLSKWSGVKKKAINANFIKTPFCEISPTSTSVIPDPYGLIIATNGPVPRTIERFWQMVIQHNVKKTVSLVEHMGNESNTRYKECYQYFPTEENPVLTLKSETDTDFFIEISLKSLTLDKHINRRTFDITFSYREETEGDDAASPENKKGPLITGKRTFQLIHFKGWVDQGMPTDPEALDALLGIAKTDCADFLRD